MNLKPRCDSSAPARGDVVSTREAADVLRMSVAYVAMLCDAGKLGPIAHSSGGERRIRREALEAFRAESMDGLDGVTSVRQAGIDAGLYENDDNHYTHRRT